MGSNGEWQTLPEVVEWLSLAPPGTQVDAAGLAEILEPLIGTPPLRLERSDDATELTWREKLWVVPPETRIGVQELAEALGRPKSWVYRRTAPSSDKAPLPHRKLDGELIFVVGEIRAWVVEHEIRVA